MNINALADETLTYLLTKYTRVYRDKSPKTPTFPYVIYRVDSITASYPSEDLYVNVDIYDNSETTSRAIEDLADTIDAGLNHKIISTTALNAQFERETRQYVPSDELVGAQAVNIRYAVRTYFK